MHDPPRYYSWRSANEYYYPNLYENQFTPQEGSVTQDEMRTNLSKIEWYMHEFCIFMQVQLDENNCTREDIQEMRERLQALENTCQQLHNAIQGESNNIADRGSGVCGRQGWGGDIGSSPGGSGGSWGSQKHVVVVVALVEVIILKFFIFRFIIVYTLM